MQRSCADLGSPPIAGTQDLSGTTWTVSGSGDVSGSADTAHMVTRPISGDVVLTAEVTRESDTAAQWAKAGIMMRASSDPGARRPTR